MKRDNIHCNLRHVDRYDKTYNFLISAREWGKSTAVVTKIYKAAVHKHMPGLVLRSQIVDITEAYIESFADTINQFLPDSKKIKLYYNKGAIKDGVIDVYMDKDRKNQLLRVVALSIPKTRMKSLTLPNGASMCLYDEYICDINAGEKYVKDMINKFKDCYATYNRWTVKRTGKRMKVYFCANPYTVFNPFHMWLNIPLDKIKKGNIIIGDDYYLECGKLSDELIAFVKRTNPLYSDENDEFSRYAFGGESVEDKRFVIMEKRPENYFLRFIFKIQKKYIYVWQSNATNDYRASKFRCEYRDDLINTRITPFAVDFSNLTSGTNLWLPEYASLCVYMRYSIARRDVIFDNIGTGYLVEEIFKLL